MVHLHLCFEDKEYGAALEKALLANSRGRWHLHRQIDQPETDPRLMALSEEGLLLTDQLVKDESVGPTLYFNEKPVESETDCYKYQTVQSILKQVTAAIYRHQLTDSVFQTKGVYHHYVYSPSGGAGVSTASLQLAKALRPEGLTLLISLDAYHRFSEERAMSGLTDFLYYYRQADKIDVKDFVIRQSSIDILQGPQRQDDLNLLRTIGKQELQTFLSERTAYQQIVWDMSSSACFDWIGDMADNEQLYYLKGNDRKWTIFSERQRYKRFCLVEGAIRPVLRGGDKNAHDIVSPDS